MKGRRNAIIAAMVSLSLSCRAFPEETGGSEDVESEIDIGVTSQLAEEAMKSGDAGTALMLLLEAVEKYPGSVTALKKYYDFLLKNRVKLDADARATALEQAQVKYPQAKSLEDVFLLTFANEEVQKPLLQVEEEGPDSLAAFEQIESLLRRHDLKRFAFYFYGSS